MNFPENSVTAYVFEGREEVVGVCKGEKRQIRGAFSIHAKVALWVKSPQEFYISVN